MLYATRDGASAPKEGDNADWKICDQKKPLNQGGTVMSDRFKYIIETNLSMSHFCVDIFLDLRKHDECMCILSN